MDGVFDIIRMQLLANQNQLVKDGRVNLKTFKMLFFIYIFTNHRLVTQRLQDWINSGISKMTLYKKYITFEKEPKGVVYLKMDNTNDVFKEMLSRHSLDFGTVRMKRIDEFHAKSSRTIMIAPDIYFEIYYGQAPLLPTTTDKNGSTKLIQKENTQSEQITEDSETYENTRGRVFSYSKKVSELVEYIQETYQPAQEKAVEIVKNEKTRMPNLSNLTVVRLTEIDKSNVLKGDKQDFIVSKNLDNIFLEPSIHEKLSSHIDRFNDRFWYASRGIPRTLGILLHGEPGCGKTSFIKSLCAAQGRVAVIIDFKLIQSVTHLRSIFQGSIELKNGSLFGFEKNKIVYVLEDFDCMSDIFMDREKKEELVKKRKELEEKAMDAMIDMQYKKKNKKKKDKNQKRTKTKKEDMSESDTDKSANEASDDNISNLKTIAQLEMMKEEDKEKHMEKFRKSLFADKDGNINLNDLLELMDGIIEMDGRIIVMTTNCKDKIDKALLRPGRIDLDLELKPPSLSLICEIFFYMYQEHDLDALTELWMKYETYLKGDILSTAKVMNCFMYIDPKVGLETFLQSESPEIYKEITAQIGSIIKVEEKNGNVQQSVLKIARTRAIARMEKITYKDEGHIDTIDTIDTSTEPVDLLKTIMADNGFWKHGQKITHESNCKLLFGLDIYQLKRGQTYYPNAYGCMKDPVEIIFTFDGFKLGITKFSMKSQQCAAKSWELYGSCCAEKKVPEWQKLSAKNEKTTTYIVTQSVNLLPSAYYTQIKLVVLSSYSNSTGLELATIDFDLSFLGIWGYYKKAKATKS